MPDIYIGTAGWAYKDWYGIVYPDKLKKSVHPVEYLAEYFNLIEINTSFYGHLKPAVAKQWCEKAAAVNPRFLFTAKLNKCFTHSPIAVMEATSASTIRCTPEDEREARLGYDALADAGRLGALLAQFPISFQNTDENRKWVNTLIEKFRDYPLALEVRHASWDKEQTLRDLTARGVAFCNIDQPMLGRALKPGEHVTSRIAYVRLHGRNYDQWFEPDHPHDRYNYLYSEKELQPWKGRVEQLARKAEVTFVVANNHFEGKAAVNALQLKSAIASRRVKVPETLAGRYPELEKIRESDPSSLFSA